MRDTPGVVAAAPLVYSQVMLSSGQSVVGRRRARRAARRSKRPSIDLKAPPRRSGSLDGLGAPFEVPVEGRQDAQDGADTSTLSGIILGKELAKQLGVAVGDPVSVVSPLGTPSPVGMIPKVKRFVVAGTFDSGMFDYDSGARLHEPRRRAAVLRARRRDHRRRDPRRTTSTRAEDGRARASSRRLGTPFRARDWMEVNRNLFLAFKLEKVVYFIVLTLIVLVAAFNIVATLIMVVMEKRKDIAILKSMGATDRSIAPHLHAEGADHRRRRHRCSASLGGYAGCWAAARATSSSSCRRTSSTSRRCRCGSTARTSPRSRWSSVVICLLATIYPARQAAGLAPVEVIRYE